MEQDLQNIIPHNFTKENNSEINLSGRDLYEYIGSIKVPFRQWIPKLVKDYGFQEGEDYKTVYGENLTIEGEPIIVDYMLSIDMAKEVAIIQKSEKGKIARQYFKNIESKLKSTQVSNSLDTTQNMKISTYQALDNNEDTINSNLYTKNLNTNFRDTAKILGVRENLLVNWLLINNYCYRNKKGEIRPYAKVMGYFTMKEFSAESGHRGAQTLINDKGREQFKRMLIAENIIKDDEVNL